MQLILDPQGASELIQDTMSSKNMEIILDNPVKNGITEQDNAEPENGITCDKENNLSINNLDIKEDMQDKDETDKAIGDLVTEIFDKEENIGNDKIDLHVEQRQSQKTITSFTKEENVRLEEDVFVTAKNSEVDAKHKDDHNLESSEDSLRNDLIQPVVAKLQEIANDQNEETEVSKTIVGDKETTEDEDNVNIKLENELHVKGEDKVDVEMKIENNKNPEVDNVEPEDKVNMDIKVEKEVRTDVETKVNTKVEDLVNIKVEGELNTKVPDKANIIVDYKENIEMEDKGNIKVENKAYMEAEETVNMKVELAKGEGQEVANLDIKDTSIGVEDDKSMELAKKVDTGPNEIEIPDAVLTSNVEQDRTETPDRAGGDGSMIATEEPSALELDLSKTDTGPNECSNITDSEEPSDVDMKTLEKEDNDDNYGVKDDSSQDSVPKKVTELFKKDSAAMDTDCSDSSQSKLTDSVSNSTEGVVALTSSESEKLRTNSNDDHGAGLSDVNYEAITSSEVKEISQNSNDDRAVVLPEEENEVITYSESSRPLHGSIDEQIVEITDEKKVNDIENIIQTCEALTSRESESEQVEITDEKKVNDVENLIQTCEALSSRESEKSHFSNDDDQVIEVLDEKTEQSQNNDVLDVDEVKIVDDVISERETSPAKTNEEKTPAPIIKLSNTMDILSDDEDESPKKDIPTRVTESTEKQCIDLDDDDDIMLIDDDVNKDDKKEDTTMDVVAETEDAQIKLETEVVDSEEIKYEEVGTSTIVPEKVKESNTPDIQVKEDKESPKPEKKNILEPEVKHKPKPLVPEEFFKTYRKNLAEMNRNDLEEFCILKIVESIIDRTNVNEIKAKLKNVASAIEEYKNKTVSLAKQNRDLQLVLQSVKEDLKNRADQPVLPLRITRSVGMQVLMTEKSRRRGTGPLPYNSNSNNMNNNVNQVTNTNTRPLRNVNQASRVQNQTKANNSPQNIPVPRLVPAANSANNKVMPQATMAKSSPMQNGTKATAPIQKSAEKRPRLQSQSSSVTVDLTDDEPPAKVMTKTPPPVRLVNQQNLMAPRQQHNSPRKVYIPISGPQAVRSGQAITLKTVAPQASKPRGPVPPMVRVQQNNMQMKQNSVLRRVQGTRHPAPLPDSTKQYQPPNWKALPPAPDLKLSKVENGIVISWKIEGYQEDSYEEIASYQLYAYQETSAPPNTTLWKKIGDVKALPLPMACTLTQFMAGYKYYFAVRAVDIKSRFGPFSLPGSILLLNKM